MAPFQGSFKPDTTLSVFDGSNAKGTWTLTVEDKARGDIGILNKWALSLSGSTTLTATSKVRRFDGEAPVAETPAAPVSAPSQGLDCPRSGIETPAPSANLQAPANNLTNGSVAQSYFSSSSLTSNANPSNVLEPESSTNEGSIQDYTSDSANLSDYFFAANSSTVSFYGIDTYESEEENESEIDIHDAIFMV